MLNEAAQSVRLNRLTGQRSRWKRCDEHRNRIRRDLLHPRSIGMTDLRALLAAVVRCRHIGASAVALHLAAAGAFIGRHPDIRESARHCRRQQ